jgi:hypothetical protein
MLGVERWRVLNHSRRIRIIDFKGLAFASIHAPQPLHRELDLAGGSVL